MVVGDRPHILKFLESTLKKAPQKILRVLHPTRISPFVVPTRKEAPTENAPMGAIPLKAVTSPFPREEENPTSEAPGVVFDPTTGEGGVETPFQMTPPKPHSVHQ